MLRDAPGSDAQQRAAQLEYLVDLVDGESGHSRAAPRLDADQPVALENPQRLADRAATDRESAGHLLFAHPVAREQLAADDGVADLLGDLLSQR